jgi:hypothetical protein
LVTTTPAAAFADGLKALGHVEGKDVVIIERSPKMYAELEKSNHLGESLHAAQERTSELMERLLAGGDAAPPGVGAGEGAVGVSPERGG